MLKLHFTALINIQVIYHLGYPTDCEQCLLQVSTAGDCSGNICELQTPPGLQPRKTAFCCSTDRQCI